MLMILILCQSFISGFSQDGDAIIDTKFLIGYLGQPLDDLKDEIILTTKLDKLTDIYYAELYSQNIFGNKPKEILVAFEDDIISQVQINYDFNSNEDFNIYQELLDMVESVSIDLGTPIIIWRRNLMEFRWIDNEKHLTIKEIDLMELEKVIIRIDLYFICQGLSKYL